MSTKRLSVLVLILVFIALISFSGILSRKSQSVPKEEKISTTSNWKKFHTKNFSIQYPDNFKISFNDTNRLGFYPKDSSNSAALLYLDYSLNGPFADFNKAVDYLTKDLSPKKVAEASYGVLIWGHIGKLEGDEQLYGLVKHKGGAILANYQLKYFPKDEELLSKILSSIVFEELQLPSSKLYTNSQAGYSFEYSPKKFERIECPGVVDLQERLEGESIEEHFEANNNAFCMHLVAPALIVAISNIPFEEKVTDKEYRVKRDVITLDGIQATRYISMKNDSKLPLPDKTLQIVVNNKDKYYSLFTTYPKNISSEIDQIINSFKIID